MLGEPFDKLRAHDAVSGRRVATGTGPPFALMHRLDTGDRNGVALGEQICVELLRRGHLIRPRIAPIQQSRRVVDREVSRHYSVKIVPGHRKRNRYAGPDPGTESGYHRGATGTC